MTKIYRRAGEGQFIFGLTESYVLRVFQLDGSWYGIKPSRDPWVLQATDFVSNNGIRYDTTDHVLVFIGYEKNVSLPKASRKELLYVIPPGIPQYRFMKRFGV